MGLTDALFDGFPALAALLGPDNMRSLAAGYLRAHPPASPVMQRFGAELPAYLETFAPLAHVAYLPDLCRLELAMRRAYHAADAAPVDPARLALEEADFAAARLRLAPSLQLLRSAWPVAEIRARALDPSRPAPPPGAQDIVVLRRAYDPEPHVLAPGCAAFITAVLAAEPLGQAVAAALAETEDFDLTPILSLLLGAGAITDVETER